MLTFKKKKLTTLMVSTSMAVSILGTAVVSAHPNDTQLPIQTEQQQNNQKINKIDHKNNHQQIIHKKDNHQQNYAEQDMYPQNTQPKNIHKKKLLPQNTHHQDNHTNNKLPQNIHQSY